MCAAPRSTRRDFLQGKTAVNALAALGAGDAPAAELPDAASDNYLLKLSRRAMACQFECFFNAGQYPLAGQLGLAALDLVDRLEDQLSVFREHSEISRLNRCAADGPIAVEPRLFAFLANAVEIHDETRGAYDITAGPLSRVWGFTGRAGAVPDEAALADARERVGSQYLALDHERGTVHFTRPGIEINLGSIGKGYALDRCAEVFAEAGIGDFLLHGGNSSVLARGAHGALSPEQGWLVGVRDPLRPARRIGRLCVRNRALATTGAGVQYFMHDERRYGHVLDPRTGAPAEGVLSATALAPSAAEADALSTAFYVAGPVATAAYCAAHPSAAAILLCPGARQGSVERHVFGLDERDWLEGDGA